MKKYNLLNTFSVLNIKFDLKMKLTFILLFIALFRINANTYSQKTKVSLNLKNVSTEDIFNKIENITEFNFFYKNTTIDLNKRIDINVEKESIQNILNIILKGENIDYEVFHKQIILKPKTFEPIVIQYKDSEKTLVLQQKITGIVTDENNQPLPGATVIIKGTNLGTSTDIDGKFSLAVPDDINALIITFLGYKTIEVEINGRTNINIQLLPDVDSLEEVVLVGYGKVNKRSVTGSIGTVEMKGITSQAPTVNLDNALQGQIAGVYVSSATGQPGAAARIRIRGTTSLLGSNQPLYVIDGIPVTVESNIPIGGTEGRNLGNELAQDGISTPIGNINSSDIQSISVLKDASAAAIYGSRAANGVIIINTKQGVYEGAPQFDVSISTTTQTAKTLDVLNAAQFKQVWTTAVNNGSSNDSYAQQVKDGSYFGDADTDWEDEISPSSPVSTFLNIGVFGGSKKTRYNTSLGVNTQNGIYNGSGFDRYSYSLNIDTEVNDIWKFGSKMNISFSDQTSLDGGLTQIIYAFRPDLPVFDEDGNYSFSQQYSTENPVARSKATSNNKTLLLLGSFYTQLQLAKGLNLKSMLAINYNSGNQQSFYPKFTFGGGWGRTTGDGDGYAQESRSNITNTMWENTLNYNGIINEDHTIDGVLGVSFEQKKNSWTKAWGEGYFNEVLTNINSATVYTGGSSFEDSSGLASYFGRVNYDFKNKYLLTLSARLDGSSKFATDNQYAFFPAAAFAWRLSNESFLEDNKIIDELKLRVSLGKTGQQDFGSYAWRTLYQSYHYGGEPAIITSQLGNDNLKWETTNQLDFGVDFELLNRRLTGSFGMYSKETIEALFYVKLPGNTGYATTIANIGDTKNTGVEFELKGEIINKNDFNWTLGFNISKNKNTLTRINDDFKSDSGYITGFTGGGYLKEGSPIGLLYGYQSEGIFQTQAEIDALNANSPTGYYQDDETSPGDLKFTDITGPEGVPDGLITSLDQKTIGDTQADFFGGISNTMSYKNLTLSTFFTYAVGNDLYAFGRARSTNFFSTYFGENKEIDVLNAWTPENNTSSIPRMVYKDPNNNGRISSHYVYDASFLRLKTINLSYTFSKSTLDNLKFIRSASIFVTGQNLWTITNYPGADPEASNLYNNDISSGRDNNRFPVAKIFTAGVRIGF